MDTWPHPTPRAVTSVEDRGDRSTPTALQRLVDDVDEFARDVWGRRPSVIAAGSDRRRLDRTSLFGLRDVDELIAASARVPTVRMVADGNVLDPVRYCRRVRLGGRELDDVVDPVKVVTLLGEGATLVLQSLHRTWPGVGSFVRELGSELSHPVQANAYLTPPSATGLAEHADVHDVFAVQLHGTKHWWVDDLGDVALRPGDVMYVPRGSRHRAETTADTSLHLTIGVIPVTYRHVVERLLARDAPTLDRPLPIGYRLEGGDEFVEGIDDALDAALDVIGNSDSSDVADRELQRRSWSPMEPGRIASFAHVDRLTADHLVRWVAPRPMVREVDRRRGTNGDAQRAHDDSPPALDRVTLDAGDRMLTVPTAVLPALSRLSDGLPVRVGDLPGLDADSRVVLTRRLVREGVCVVADG